VTVIDNFATGRRDNLVPHVNLNVVEGTIANTNVVGQAFGAATPDVVVHAAAAYKDPESWEEDVATNILGSVSIVRAAQKAKVRRIVLFPDGTLLWFEADGATDHAQSPDSLLWQQLCDQQDRR